MERGISLTGATVKTCHRNVKLISRGIFASTSVLPMSAHGLHRSGRGNDQQSHYYSEFARITFSDSHSEPACAETQAAISLSSDRVDDSLGLILN